jgi:aminopeptidase N
MSDTAPQPIYLCDYTPPAFLVDHVALTFMLAPTATRVQARVRFRPNPAAQPGQDLRLDGENLVLISAMINGQAAAVQIDSTSLFVPSAALPDGAFEWVSEVEISPATNTALEGLYMSNGMFCTQCEAEGFRKITYYPDRPDVMAPFTVRIESALPVLLSNGNPTAQGDGWAEWTDPHPKPAYLFALVAGDLVAATDSFRTMEGVDVTLNIWVRPGDEGKTSYALDALTRSMVWDEETYGRAYDLRIFNIVAVDDFNMGAMENKGLNIFNSRYVLASPDTATDADYASIERIIAHEYFHNWTGNRITCRDWFQLSLKEGLTVYRDQTFMGDMRSHPVKRIEDVLTLRARQFREDAGPLAHPVRPDHYVEINNFYTATVYEKGAELIRMMRILVGDAAYHAALDLYFARHDGQACTIEDWVQVFTDISGRDLTQFTRWYAQAGTPRVSVTQDWDGTTYSLTLSQMTPPTPGQTAKDELVIPVAIGLLASDGAEVLPTQILELTAAQSTFRFEGLGAHPTASVLRGFSAPVVLDWARPQAELAHLLAHDTDPFARWEAGRTLARGVLQDLVLHDTAPAPEFVHALDAALSEETLDPAFRALAISLPSQDDIALALFEAGHTPDPTQIHAALKSLRHSIATTLQGTLAKTYDDMTTPGAYDPGAEAAGRRSLRLQVLGLLSLTDGGVRADEMFAQADNMTEQSGAWGALLAAGHGAQQTDAFYAQWQHDRLVVDKWFMAQVLHASPKTAVATADALTKHAAFDWKNPNRFRSVIGALAVNAAGFHDPSGAGYSLVADWVMKLDAINPQAAARQSSAFETWRRFDPARQAKMHDALTRIGERDGVSRDMGEMVKRMLGA